MNKMRWYDYILVIFGVFLRFFFELGTIPMAFIFLGWETGVAFIFLYAVFILNGLYFTKFNKAK